MNFEEARRREDAIVEAWRERMRETPPRFPCHDCAQNYKYQWSDATLDAIREGEYLAGNGYNEFLVCSYHQNLRSGI